MRNFVLASVLAASACLGACGPHPIAYIKPDHPGAKEILEKDVALVYAHEDTPEGATIIAHVKETGRHSECKRAAMIALVQMQKGALEREGNAVVNIRPVPEGDEPVSSSEGFWCERSKSFEEGGDLGVKIWKITWEGDIARIIESY